MNNQFLDKTNGNNVIKEDLSEEHYHILSSMFEDLSSNIQNAIHQHIRDERDYRLSRYNQNLLMQLPKHMLIKVRPNFKNLIINMEANQTFQIYDIKSKRNFIYSTLSEIALSSLTMTKVEVKTGKIYLKLKPALASKLNQNTFDLWLNPLLWETVKFNLCQFKQLLIQKKNLIVKITYSDLTEKICAAHLEDQQYSLALNDKMRLRLLSPEFLLGFQVVLSEIPVIDENIYITELACIFDIDLYDYAEFSDIINNKDRLFETNVIPLFNLYEGYSSAQRLDDKFDKIPLTHPEDTEARACYVQQIWVNNHNYKEYYNHIVSEYVFHKHVGKLSYYPKDIKKAVTIEQKVFAKVLWRQNGSHGNLLKITSNAIATTSNKFDLICTKKGTKINSFRHIDRVVQVFRAFSDLDIRNADGFLFALKFLCGDENRDLYQCFKKSIKKIEYDRLHNVLVIIVKHQLYEAYVNYTARVISDFFYVNSPQVVEVKICISR